MKDVKKLKTPLEFTGYIASLAEGSAPSVGYMMEIIQAAKRIIKNQPK